MTRICIWGVLDENAVDQWSYLLGSFTVDELFIAGVYSSSIRHPNKTYISYDKLPRGPKVMLQPAEGRYLQGTQSLVDFKHPKDPLYIFGPDHENIEAQDIKPFPKTLVYIPTTGLDLWSWQAAAITLYDRSAKK